MRFIDNIDLRQWVQENLQRKLVQQAHELAVQTGCEVLLRLQDGTESPKYYVTDGMKHDYVNYGVRADPGDLPMSGESGLPKKYVHDFTCQVACQPTGPAPYTPDHLESHEADIIMVKQQQQRHHPISEQDVLSSEEWKRLYRERLWTQQTSTSTSKLDAAMHTELEVERRWPGANGQRPYVYPVSSLMQSDASVPTATEMHIASQLDDSDAALRNLKDLQFERLLRHGMKEEGRMSKCPLQSKPTDDREGLRILSYPEDHVERPNEVLFVSQIENPPLPPPPPPSPRPQQPPQHNVRASMPNGTGFDPKTLAPVGSTQQRYLCRICERTFCDLFNLVSHAKMFHSSLPDLIFACNSCKSSFEDATSLHDHLLTHGQLGFFAGAACQLKSRSQDRQNVVHQRRFPCPDCGKIFSRFGFMQSHIERVHGGTRIAASLDTTALAKDTTALSKDTTPCPAGSNTGNSVEHVIVVRNSSGHLYRCMDCEESFDSAELLQQHMKKSHPGQKTSSAPPVFTEDVELPVQRIRSKSEDVTFDGKEIYTCQECGKQFPRGKLLQNHVNNYHIPGNLTVASHRDEQTFNNQVEFIQSEQYARSANGAQFKVKKEPNREILDLSTGNSIRNFSLPLSDDSADTPPEYPGSSPGTPGSEAKQMEDQEMGDGNDQGVHRRRFACDVCGKSYKYGFHMKEHRLTHAAVCPFVCRICGMGFFRQRQLRDHELRHTGAYPCRCEICGKGFPRTSELKRHLAFRHRRLDMFGRQKSTSPSPNEEQT